MRFLGLRNGHDANYTYTDGTNVKYVKLERKVQIKHFLYDPEERKNDVIDLLKAADADGVPLNDLDGVCINPSLDRHTIMSGPKAWEVYTKVDTKLDHYWSIFKCPVYAIDHHYAHVLSCWPLTSNLPDVNLVVDGLGDYNRQTSIFRGEKLVHSINFAETPGVSTTLDRLGKAAGLGGMRLDMSGKMMALQSYHTIPEDIIERFVNECGVLSFSQLELIRPIAGEYPAIFTDDKDGHTNAAFLVHLWASICLPKLLKQYADPKSTVTYTGGTAQNTWLNSRLRKHFPNIIIPPHCPDEGISIGCVELLRRLFDQPEFSTEGFPFWQDDQEPDEKPTKGTIDLAAEYLAQGKVVGWYQGHGEIGPRALGHRSILMDPSIKDGKDKINKIKKRESFRPFGASVLLKDAHTYFDFEYPSPYMLYVADVLSKDFPAITHVDGTCRHQTVSEFSVEDELYYSLIEAFQKKTGIPMLLNTSLNVDGKPIAGYVEDAKKVFEDSGMDAMVIGNNIMRR